MAYWIIDGHEDMAWNAVMLGRDITQPLAEIRTKEGPHPWHEEGAATVSLPALRGADVRMVMATVYATPAGASAVRHDGYRTPEEAYRQACAQLEYYYRLAAAAEVAIIRLRDALETAAAGGKPCPGLVLVMEGADALRSPADLEQFVERGVRAVGLAWKRTRYAGGTGEPGPLTEAGIELLSEMDRLGVALDVSHLAEASFWQALDLFKGRVIASHANCRALVPTDRQLSDDMIRAIADRDGVIGLVLYNRFIRADWTPETGKDAIGLSALLPHVEHIANLVGLQHLGIGSDLDGGIGREIVPREIDSVADLPRFAEVLAEAGYDAPAIAGIMAENWLRVLRGILR